MTERVVDVLESIEVEEQDAEHPLIAPRGEPGPAQAGAGKDAESEARQRGGEGLGFAGGGGHSEELARPGGLRFSLSGSAPSARLPSTNSPIGEPMSFMTATRPSSRCRGAHV